MLKCKERTIGEVATITNPAYILAIVGTQLVKDYGLVKTIIRYYVENTATIYPDLKVISGGADGVDTIVKEVCGELEVGFAEYSPESPNWNGYKKRNRKIVEDCTELLVIRYKDNKSYGSGWTRDFAKQIGKKLVDIEIRE
ncbi:MAG: hypothetical protein V3U02_05775 [Calditrichia bacterium]